MDEFVWTDDLKTGDEVVDYQHKKIFYYLNILIATTDRKDIAFHILQNTINGLVEYTNIHFADEEMILQSLNCPDFEIHQKEHRACANQILSFKQRFDKGEDIRVELIAFIKNWLTDHLKEVDMKALKPKK